MKRSIQTRTWRRRARVSKFFTSRIKKRTLKTRKSLIKKSIPRRRTRLPALPKGRTREGLRVRGY